MLVQRGETALRHRSLTSGDPLAASKVPGTVGPRDDCDRSKLESPFVDLVKALIVEDDPIIGDFVARGLREGGFAVDVADDGHRGLALALEMRPDVAVVDVMLPGWTGWS